MQSNPAVHLLLVGTQNDAFRLAASIARESGAHVVLAEGTYEAVALLRDCGGDIVMVDIEQDVAGFIRQLRAERIAVPVLACGIDASADRAVAAIRAGARDYVPLPPQPDLIAAAILSVTDHGTRMIGSDPAFARATALALAMAHSSAPLTITGAAGCGKTMLARAIHAASGRRGRFLVVDCAGGGGEGSDEILESELFGHAAGAFSGAVARRRGRIEEAIGGTIVLRDIDALSPPLQARLLGVLQQEGGSPENPLGPRIVATTTTDLDHPAGTVRFNPNLLVRIGLVRIAVPPLRLRRDDIAPIARYFGERFALANDMAVCGFDADAVALLQRHDWPGNVRELEDTVHRAVLLNREALISPRAIVTASGEELGTEPALSLSLPQEPSSSFVGRTVEDVERDLILHTLRHCRGNRTSASTILGISVRTMRNKLKTFVEAGIAVAPCTVNRGP